MAPRTRWRSCPSALRPPSANCWCSVTNTRGIAEAAILMEKATGQAIGKTVEQFKELEKSPTEAVAKINEQTNFLTASLYQQIKALEDQGKKTEAANLAERAYADALKTR